MTRTHTQYAVALLLLSSIAGIALAEPPAKVDAYGDPLPVGAIARLGTVRWRHADGASFVAFLPDSKSVLSVGGDATVRIWDAATGKELRRFGAAGAAGMGPGTIAVREIPLGGFDEIDANPHTISLSADGKLLAMGDIYCAVRIYDVGAGKEVRQVAFKYAAPTAIALSGDAKTLAIGTSDSIIHLYDSATGKEAKKLGKIGDANKQTMVSGLALAPDGKTLAAVTYTEESKSELTVWDAASGKPLSRIAGKEQAPDFGGIEFSPDGNWLGWIGHDWRVVLAERQTGKEVRRLKFGLFSRAFAGFTFAADSKTVLAWEQGTGKFCTWETATGKHVRNFKGLGLDAADGEGNNANSVAVSPEGKLIAWAGAGPISIIDVEKGSELHRHDAHRRPIIRVCIDADAKQVVTMDEGQRLRSWDATTGKLLRAIPTPRNRPVSGLSDDGRLLVVRSARNAVSLLELASGKEIRTIATGLDGPWAPVLSPDGKLLAVPGTKGKMCVIGVYDVASGKETRQFALPNTAAPPDEPVPPPPGVAVALELGLPRGGTVFFSPDGRILAAMLDARRVALWDVTTGRELPIIEAPQEHAIRSLALTPDGKSVAVDGDDGISRLYETATGHERRRFETKLRPGQTVQDIDLKAAQIGLFMDLEIGGLIQGQIAVSPNGRLLVHARQRGVIAIWDVRGQKEIGQLTGHQADVNTLAFSADGKTLASGSRDTTVLLWDMTKFALGAKPQAVKLDAAANWNDLLGTDAVRAFDAICALAAAPGDSVTFLKEHARPAASADVEKVERLIANLDSARFAERKNASTELEKIGESTIPLLRKALEGDPTPEARKRIEELLKKTDSGAPRGELLRSLRAVEVLETIATPEAKAVLQTLAKGTAEATLTRSAQAALDRLGHPR